MPCYDTILVTKHLHFCAAHRLHGDNGPCAFLHGHNYMVDITIRGVVALLEPDGILINFRTIKALCQEWLDKYWDHCFIHGPDTFSKQIAALLVQTPAKGVTLASGSRTYELSYQPTAENMARFLHETWQRDIKLPIDSITVWETPDSFATFRPEIAEPDPRSARDHALPK